MKMKALESASKMSLLLMVSAVWICAIAVTMWNISDPDVIKTVLMIFSNAVSLVLGFYFWQKSLNSK